MSVPAGPEVPTQTPILPALGARVALGHVRRAFDMARQDMADAVALAHCSVERIDRRARDAEGRRHALALQYVNGGFYRPHPGHLHLPFAIHRLSG